MNELMCIIPVLGSPSGGVITFQFCSLAIWSNDLTSQNLNNGTCSVGFMLLLHRVVGSGACISMDTHTVFEI